MKKRRDFYNVLYYNIIKYIGVKMNVTKTIICINRAVVLGFMTRATANVLIERLILIEWQI
jgi:hypothetical protein